MLPHCSNVIFATLVVAAVALSGGISRAQDAPEITGRGAVRAACADDFKRLCSDVTPGGGRIRTCMRDHKDELSPGCAAAMKAAADARAKKGGG
jgi:Cysteine rich repeat